MTVVNEDSIVRLGFGVENNAVRRVKGVKLIRGYLQREWASSPPWGLWRMQEWEFNAKWGSQQHLLRGKGQFSLRSGMWQLESKNFLGEGSELMSSCPGGNLSEGSRRLGDNQTEVIHYSGLTPFKIQEQQDFSKKSKIFVAFGSMSMVIRAKFYINVNANWANSSLRNLSQEAHGLRIPLYFQTVIMFINDEVIQDSKFVILLHSWVSQDSWLSSDINNNELSAINPAASMHK